MQKPMTTRKHQVWNGKHSVTVNGWKLKSERSSEDD